MEETVHNFKDLESCYNRQLEIFCGVAEEAIGVERLAIKITTKLIPRFEHCICTNFGISDESCGGRNDHVGGLG